MIPSELRGMLQFPVSACGLYNELERHDPRPPPTNYASVVLGEVNSHRFQYGAPSTTSDPMST